MVTITLGMRWCTLG